MTLNDALNYPWNSQGITTMIRQIFKEFELEKKDTELKDIDGKSIYADSSVFEFDFYLNMDKCDKLIGYFYFNDEIKAFNIKVLDNEISEIGYAKYYKIIKNFKIIDTIQENKLNLIEDKYEKRNKRYNYI